MEGRFILVRPGQKPIAYYYDDRKSRHEAMRYFDHAGYYDVPEQRALVDPNNQQRLIYECK